VAAAGALVVAQMAEVRGVVAVQVPAAAAVLGVERVLERRKRVGAVLQTEVGDPWPLGPAAVAPEVRDQRIVRVQDEGGPAGVFLDEAGPVVGQRLELAVTVELVAEEVAEDDGPRV